MAGGFIADATSLPLVISNLTNILSADFFHIGFAAYAARMLPVDLCALVASTGVLYLYYRRALPARLPDHPLPAPAEAIADRRLFRLTWPALAVMMAGYLASGPLGIPVSAVAGATALWLLILAARTPALDVRRAVREAPWRIVVFSAGMYVVVFGLRDAGLIGQLSRILTWAAGHGMGTAVFVTGLSIGLLSAAMNNLPSVLVGTLAIHGSAVAHQRTALGMVLANIVGSDLGPKMTPIGSLATLLWLHVLERRGLRIGWGYYCRVGVVLTLPVLVITLAALWLVMVRP
jgi:arsenical pump membrane protein